VVADLEAGTFVHACRVGGQATRSKRHRHALQHQGKDQEYGSKLPAS